LRSIRALAACSSPPDSSELTLRASHNLARVGCNVYTGNCLVVTRELILELVSAARLLEEVDVVLSGYSERLAVGGEGMVRNGMVEEVVDFGAGHDGYEGRRAIGDSLLLPIDVLGCKLWSFGRLGDVGLLAGCDAAGVSVVLAFPKITATAASTSTRIGGFATRRAILDIV